MSLWDLKNAPTWFPSAVATKAGWINPATGEILIAISELPLKRHDFIDAGIDNLTLGDGFDLILSPILTESQVPEFLLLG